MVAEANLDVNGRFVRAQLNATTAREAVDLLHEIMDIYTGAKILAGVNA